MKTKTTTIRRLLAFFMSIITLVSMFATISMPASAAATTSYVKEETSILRNEKTGKCYNRYAGGTYNGCKVTLWSYSKGDTDLYIRPVYCNGGYKLFDHKQRVIVSDVYRGNNNKAKKNMKMNVWQNQASENDFQIFLFEKQSNGSYIMRLKSNPSLAIGISSNKNGADLRLVTYNKNDSGQRWFFCTTSNVKKNVSLSAPQGSKNTVSKENQTIQLVNSVRSTYVNTLKSMKKATESVYSTASAWTRNNQCAKFIGITGGSALKAVAGCTTGSPVAVFDSAVTVFKEAAEPETSLAITTIVALKAVSNDTIYWCNQAISLLSKNITTYNQAVQAIDAISMAYGNYAASMWLGRPIVEDAAAANPWTSTFKNMGFSILEGCGFKAADALSKFENVVYLKDMLKSYKVTQKYNNARTSILNKLIIK